MDCLLLDRLNLQWLQFLIKDLAQIHDNTFMDLRYISMKPNIPCCRQTYFSATSEHGRFGSRKSSTLEFCHAYPGDLSSSETEELACMAYMKMPVKSNCTWNPTYTFARLIVGLHHRVNRRLGIWLRPER